MEAFAFDSFTAATAAKGTAVVVHAKSTFNQPGLFPDQK